LPTGSNTFGRVAHQVVGRQLASFPGSTPLPMLAAVSRAKRQQPACIFLVCALRVLLPGVLHGFCALPRDPLLLKESPMPMSVDEVKEPRFC
jgi:hypothetical protein